MSANLLEADDPENAVPLADPLLSVLALRHWPGDAAVLRPDLSIEWIHPRFAQRLGLPAERCRGLNWLALHPTAAIHEAEYLRAARGHAIELPPFPIAGPERLGAWAATLQPLSNGSTMRGLLVTEREVPEPELPQVAGAVADRSRDRFALALECAQLGFYEWDMVADVLYGLDPWLLSVGLEPYCGVAGHNARWRAHVHPDDLPLIEKAYREHYQGQTEFAEVEYRIRTGDGTWHWIFVRSQVTARAPDGTAQRLSGVCMLIDQRKRTEFALRDSELRLAAAVWGAGFGLWELDVASQRARWFSNWCELEDLHSCEGPDHVGLWDMHIHPQDLPRAEQLFSDLIENRHDVYEAEYRIRTRSGSWLWIMERCRATIRGPDGKPRRIVGVCMNIHARKLAEMALRESQLRLKSIAENSSDWLLLLDAEQRVAFLNRAIGRLLPEQAIGRPFASLLPPNEVHRLGGFVADVLRGLERSEQEFVAQDPMLQGRNIMLRARPVHAEGRVVGVVVTVTDVTQRRRNEQLLQLQARILETIREGVVLIDAGNRIRLTNPAFDAMLGFAAGELVGQSIEPLFRMGESRRGAAERLLREQLASARAEAFEFDCARRDGTTFAAACVVTPFSVDGGDHWLAVINDVTDRRRLEREILEVSNREQQRIGNDLHDGLGQELTGVAMMLRGLATRIRRQHPDAAPEIDEIIRLQSQSIHNARTLARGLSPVSLERGGLLPALRTLTTRAREAYGIGIALRTRSSLPIRVDESSANHLYRIVQEALSNAVRHGRATRIRIQVTVDEHLVRISIRDNGRGLPADGPPQTGLGLRTMHYRARMVGGDLVVANHRLGGTVVRCICPQGAREPQSLAVAEARAHARAHAGRRPLR